MTQITANFHGPGGGMHDAADQAGSGAPSSTSTLVLTRTILQLL